MSDQDWAVVVAEYELRDEIERICKERGIELVGQDRDDAIRFLNSSLHGIISANIERLAEDAVEKAKVTE